jgi:hypothetical protein
LIGFFFSLPFSPTPLLYIIQKISQSIFVNPVTNCNVKKHG